MLKTISHLIFNCKKVVFLQISSHCYYFDISTIKKQGQIFHNYFIFKNIIISSITHVFCFYNYCRRRNRETFCLTIQDFSLSILFYCIFAKGKFLKVRILKIYIVGSISTPKQKKEQKEHSEPLVGEIISSKRTKTVGYRFTAEAETQDIRLLNIIKILPRKE